MVYVIASIIGTGALAVALFGWRSARRRQRLDKNVNEARKPGWPPFERP